MKTTTRIAQVVLAFLAVLILYGATAAPAAAAEVSGNATLTAQGVGTVRIEGEGNVVIAGGAGTVWVSGADEIVTEGRGRRTTLADGTIRLTGYSGRITITGASLVVRVVGGTIGLSATGSGSAVLTGKGSYTAGAQSGAWAKNGLTVEFQSNEQDG